jgi:hypothetical protein
LALRRGAAQAQRAVAIDAATKHQASVERDAFSCGYFG